MADNTYPINAEYLLDDIDFPSEKAGLVDYAESNGASEQAMEIFRALPERRYHNIQDVNDYLGLIEALPMPANQFSSKKDDTSKTETQYSASKKVESSG